ncbi:MAG: thiol-disulfide oxidoreductase DCC family protein [Phycisphaerales bacterium]
MPEQARDHDAAPSVPDALDQANEADTHPVVLFDGVCNLCNSSVQWIIRRDRRALFRFASLQSEAARRLLERHAPGRTLPDSVVLVAEGRVLVKSSAALGVARRLGPPWSLAMAAWIVPRPVRDWVYAWVARNRYRWFGKREACMVPSAALRGRFLESGAAPSEPSVQS